MEKYKNRVNLFRDMIKLDDGSDNVDFYLCEKLLENFIQMNLVYKIINDCSTEDFHVNPCYMDTENNRLNFVIKAPSDEYINAVSSYIAKINNIIYYGRNKDMYEINCFPNKDEIKIYFIHQERDD